MSNLIDTQLSPSDLALGTAASNFALTHHAAKPQDSMSTANAKGALEAYQTLSQLREGSIPLPSPTTDLLLCATNDVQGSLADYNGSVLRVTSSTDGGAAAPGSSKRDAKKPIFTAYEEQQHDPKKRRKGPHPPRQCAAAKAVQPSSDTAASGSVMPDGQQSTALPTESAETRPDKDADSAALNEQSVQADSPMAAEVAEEAAVDPMLWAAQETREVSGSEEETADTKEKDSDKEVDEAPQLGLSYPREDEEQMNQTECGDGNDEGNDDGNDGVIETYEELPVEDIVEDEIMQDSGDEMTDVAEEGESGWVPHGHVEHIYGVRAVLPEVAQNSLYNTDGDTTATPSVITPRVQRESSVARSSTPIEAEVDCPEGIAGPDTTADQEAQMWYGSGVAESQDVPVQPWESPIHPTLMSDVTPMAGASSGSSEQCEQGNVIAPESDGALDGQRQQRLSRTRISESTSLLPDSARSVHFHPTATKDSRDHSGLRGRLTSIPIHTQCICGGSVDAQMANFISNCLMCTPATIRKITEFLHQEELATEAALLAKDESGCDHVESKRGSGCVNEQSDDHVEATSASHTGKSTPQLFESGQTSTADASGEALSGSGDDQDVIVRVSSAHSQLALRSTARSRSFPEVDSGAPKQWKHYHSADGMLGGGLMNPVVISPPQPVPSVELTQLSSSVGSRKPIESRAFYEAPSINWDEVLQLQEQELKAIMPYSHVALK